MPGKQRNTRLSKSEKGVDKPSPVRPLQKYGSGHKHPNQTVSLKSVLNDMNPSYSITSRIRPIGNSKGIILPNRVIEESRISPTADLVIRAGDGVILIAEAESHRRVNTSLSSWDDQFKN